MEHFAFVILTFLAVSAYGGIIPDLNMTCSHTGMCYHISPPGQYTFPQAKAYCTDRKLSLPVPTCPEDNDFLTHTMTSSTHQFWLDMHHVTSGIWVRDSTLLQQISWLNWFKDQKYPEANGGEAAKCAFLVTSSGAWFDSLCNTFMDNVVCEEKVECPIGWTAGPGPKCYNSYTAPTHIAYADIENICKHLNANLAIPVNKVENDFLVKISRNDFFIGISNQGDRGVFKYDFGPQQNRTATWTNWASTTDHWTGHIGDNSTDHTGHHWTDHTGGRCVVVDHHTGLWIHDNCIDVGVNDILCEIDY